MAGAVWTHLSCLVHVCPILCLVIYVVLVSVNRLCYLSLSFLSLPCMFLHSLSPFKLVFLPLYIVPVPFHVVCSFLGVVVVYFCPGVIPPRLCCTSFPFICVCGNFLMGGRFKLLGAVLNTFAKLYFQTSI